MDCQADGVHLHEAHAMIVFHGHVVTIDDTAIALVPNNGPVPAQRIVDLLNEHGLVTVPDTLAPTFPPPNPAARVSSRGPEGVQ